MEIIINAQLIVFVIVIIILCFLFMLAGIKFGRRQERHEWEGKRMEEIIQKRLKQSRAVLGGLVSEQIAPLLPGFPFDPGDCRFVGKPVDFIVFKGMNEKNISEVVFVEVKSGSGKNLNDQEKKLREVIKSRKVSWAEYDAGIVT